MNVFYIFIEKYKYSIVFIVLVAHMCLQPCFTKNYDQTATAGDGRIACSEVHEPVMFYHTETM